MGRKRTRKMYGPFQTRKCRVLASNMDCERSSGWLYDLRSSVGSSAVGDDRLWSHWEVLKEADGCWRRSSWQRLRCKSHLPLARDVGRRSVVPRLWLSSRTNRQFLSLL